MNNEKNIWPQNKTCGAFISFNLDAEYFGKIYYPDVDVKEGDILRLGRSSIQFGLPKILDLLDKYQVKSTFFIPAAVAESYPDSVLEISERGHEIGCHGYFHENLGILSYTEQENILKKAIDILEKITGQKISGFRMPEGEITEDTLKIVKKLGLKYSSSLSDDDVPYIRKTSEILEIPIHWELFDLPYFVFTFDPPIPPGQSRGSKMDDVLENWLIELEAAKKFGTIYNLQLDPQTIGEQGRIYMLEKILNCIKESPEIWLATGNEIADYFICAEVKKCRKQF